MGEASVGGREQRRLVGLSATFAVDGRHIELFTPIVPPPRTGNTSPSAPTVVEVDGAPAVIQASVLPGAFGSPVSGPAQPPLLAPAHGSFAHPEPLRTPECARLFSS